MEVYRAARAECRAPFVDVLEAAVAVCAADRDAAQSGAFRCRDAARELVKPDLAACRQTFRAGAEACPPPGGSPSGAFVRRS